MLKQRLRPFGQTPPFVFYQENSRMAKSSGNLDCKVYIGDLGYGAAKQELEEIFSKYGPLTSVWVARNPPGFAFVEFEDKRDADDAIHGADGTRINGRTVRVEPCSGKTRQGRGGGGSRRGGGRPQYGGGRSSYNRDRSRSRSPQRRYRSRSRSPAERRRKDSRSPPAKESSSRRDWD